MYYNENTGNVCSEVAVSLLGFNWEAIKSGLINRFGIYKIIYHRPTAIDMQGIDSALTSWVLAESPVKTENGYEWYYTTVDLDINCKLCNISVLAAELANEARAAADATTNAYLAEFSETEKLTFPKQAEEVHAYLADSSAPTPTLDALASVRGIGREEQLAKAVAKVQAFEQLSIAIVGQQQAYEDTIKSIVASDDSPEDKVKALRALTFTYGGSGE